jgi:hypothetical protein
MSYGDEYGVTPQMPPIMVTGEMRLDLTHAPVIVIGSTHCTTITVFLQAVAATRPFAGRPILILSSENYAWSGNNFLNEKHMFFLITLHFNNNICGFIIYHFIVL